ncbi:hypothetical protein [Hylemonella gracilis]|nr:hypothetical protein [Hylemonella gracilis]
MSHLHSRVHALPALLGGLLLSLAFAPANAETLMERRSAIQKGTNQGVVIVPARPDTDASTTDAAGTEQRTGLGAIFNKLPPPSGCPMEVARNGGCPDQGLTLPTGEPSSSNKPSVGR